MQSNPEYTPDYSELLKLAQSPVGQQFIEALKQNQGQNLSIAMAKAAMGDYSLVRQAITEFLSTAEAKALLEKLGR